MYSMSKDTAQKILYDKNSTSKLTDKNVPT